jgi:hypothetical protein
MENGWTGKRNDLEISESTYWKAEGPHWALRIKVGVRETGRLDHLKLLPARSTSAPLFLP